MKAYRVPGCDIDYHRPSWLEFADAVYAINYGNRAMSVVSSMRGMSIEEESARDDDAMTDFSGTITEMSEEDAEETIALLKLQGNEILQVAREGEAESQESDDDLQEIVNAPRAVVGPSYGLTIYTNSESPIPIESGSTGLFLQGLEEYVEVETELASSPSPSNRSEDTPEATPPSSASSSQTIIIDLQDETDSDVEIELEITGSQETRGTPISEDIEEEYVIVGSGRRGRRVMLPLRTKSESVMFLGSRKIDKS